MASTAAARPRQRPTRSPSPASPRRAGDTHLRVATPRATPRRPALADEFALRGFALQGVAARPELPAIDHVVVASSGVWVVATEQVHCARVSVRRRHLTGDHVLRIGTRDRTAVLDLLDQQITAVRAHLFDALDAPVQAALLLPGAEFPLLRSLAARDHLILRPAQFLSHLDARGPLRRSRAREISQLLTERLQPAGTAAIRTP